MKSSHRILLLAALTSSLGIACLTSDLQSNTTPASVTQTPALPSTAVSTAVDLATEVVPTPTPILAFFTEEFGPSYSTDQWEVFNLSKGSTANLVIQQQDDQLLFDLGAEDVYIYYMYKPYTYTDIALTLRARNLGRNNNNVSLVCRMNEDATQWYEFSVTSSGLWNLYAMDDHRYNIIGRGGSNFLKQGREENEYQMICNGNTITLLINGNEIKSITQDQYKFEKGFVGFNISSIKDYSVLPITVAVDSFDVSHP